MSKTVPTSITPDPNIPLHVFKASAGSGKTFRLATDYLKLLIQNPESYANILAVTFTNKATNEMKSRILSELYGIANNLSDSDKYLQIVALELGKSEAEIRAKAKEALSSMLHNYSRFRIETIDSFFQSILRNLAKELGQSAYMNLELDPQEPLKDAVHELLNRVKDDPTLMNWISNYIDEKLQSDKSWHINSELESFGQNIFREDFKKMEREINTNAQNNVLRNKTSLINYKNGLEKHLDSLLEKLCDYAQKFHTIIQKHDLTTDDFSYGKSGVAGYFDKILENGDYTFELSKRAMQCMDDATAWTKKTHPRAKEIIQLAEQHFIPILKETEEYREKIIIDINSISLISKDLNKLGLLHDIASIISEQNKSNNQFILADTPTLLNEMIGQSDAPFIYEKVGAHINHIMIDEFQDTSLIQWSNFKPLLLEGLSQNAASLIVGDPKQSIYRWRNGDWRTIINLGNDPDLNAQIIPMKDNRRSEENIILFINALFKNTLSIPLFDDYPRIKMAYSDVEQIPHRKGDGYIHVEFIENCRNKEEYNEETLERLVANIEALQEQGITADEITILVRKNKSIPLIAQYLSDYKINNPESPYIYDVISDDAYLLSSSLAVQIIIQAMQFISNPENPIYAAQLIFSYQTTILKRTNNDIVNNISSKSENEILELLLQKTALLPLYEMAEEIYRVLDLKKIQNQECYMYSFLDGLNDFLVRKSSDINQFLQYWEERLCLTTIPFSSEIKGIKIMSIHKSKGLEFHSVIVPFCDWTLSTERGHSQLLWCKTDVEPYNELPLIPITYNSKMEKSIFRDEFIEETEQLYVDNLNILYVALTRAKENLIILGEIKSSSNDNISTVSDLLLDYVQQSELWKEDTLSYTYNSICTKREADPTSLNIFKQKPEAIYSQYESHPQKAKFRQSNQSKDFINERRETEENEYISRGKVLHALFAQIKTANDIHNAANRLLFEGVIANETERDKYVDIVQKAINQQEVKEWFAEGLELFNECEIVYKEENNPQTRRPDRVIKHGEEMIVVDYKFGKKKKGHNTQVKRYLDLLQQMGYKAKGYLWYIESSEIETVA